MFLEGDDLTKILAAEDRWIADIKKRWHTSEITEQAEKALRMGKRTELLGDLQFSRQKPVVQVFVPATEVGEVEK